MVVIFIRSSMVFFFSSRRRHTISLCDWSSDVCSSDLHRLEDVAEELAHRLRIPFKKEGAAGQRRRVAGAFEVRAVTGRTVLCVDGLARLGLGGSEDRRALRRRLLGCNDDECQTGKCERKEQSRQEC